MTLWQDVSQELMSDEEDEGDSLKIKSPYWRCQQLDDLIATLDKRIAAKNGEDSRQTLRKRRIVAESAMKRKPSGKLKGKFLRSHSDEDDEL